MVGVWIAPVTAQLMMTLPFSVAPPLLRVVPVICPTSLRVRVCWYGRRAAGQSVSTLPSTPSDWPEMLAPASESRKATVAATSQGLVIRRIEMFPR